MSQSICVIDDCSSMSFIEYRDMCKSHFFSMRKRGLLGPRPFFPCKEEGCDNEARVISSGLCTKHLYREYRKKKKMKTAEASVDSKSATVKHCYYCSEDRDIELFSRNSKSSDGRAITCNRCVTLRRHNLTFSQFQSIVESQGAVCAVCREDYGTKYNIDHDHSCCPGGNSCGECVRGVLCGMCNKGLGFFKDNISRITEAAEYLKKYKEADS